MQSLPTHASALESSISALERAISALESEIKALESSSVPWEYSVWVFTFLVVFGVSMELWLIWHEYYDEMDTWTWSHFGIIRSPSRPLIKKFRIEIASVLLVAIGVMGELGAGLTITSINNVLRGKSAVLQSKGAELRSKSDQLLALVKQQAGEAYERASKNEIEAERLRKTAKAEDLKVEQLRKANNDAAATLEAEKRKRLQLAASLLPRFFRDQSGAIQTLSAFKTHPISAIFEFADDLEVTDTAEQINFVVSALHWQSSRKIGCDIPAWTGVTISPGKSMPPLPPKDQSSERAAVLWWTQVDEWRANNATMKALAESFAGVLRNSGIEAKAGTDEAESPLPRQPPTLCQGIAQNSQNQTLNRVKDQRLRKSCPKGRL
jgi:hypothetical protein